MLTILSLAQTLKQREKCMERSGSRSSREELGIKRVSELRLNEMQRLSEGGRMKETDSVRRG